MAPTCIGLLQLILEIVDRPGSIPVGGLRTQAEPQSDILFAFKQSHGFVIVADIKIEFDKLRLRKVRRFQIHIHENIE